jgi:hypothetical protein
VADLNRDDYYFLVPLTRKVALAGHLAPGEKDRGFVPAPSSLVTAINAEVWGRAIRYRFAPRMNFTGSTLIIAWEQRNDFLRKQVAALSGGARRVVNVIWRKFPPATVADAEKAAVEAFEDLRMFHAREEVAEAIGYVDALIANRHQLQESWAEPLRWWRDKLAALAQELKPRRRDEEQSSMA